MDAGWPTPVRDPHPEWERPLSPPRSLSSCSPTSLSLRIPSPRVRHQAWTWTLRPSTASRGSCTMLSPCRSAQVPPTSPDTPKLCESPGVPTQGPLTVHPLPGSLVLSTPPPRRGSTTRPTLCLWLSARRPCPGPSHILKTEESGSARPLGPHPGPPALVHVCPAASTPLPDRPSPPTWASCSLQPQHWAPCPHLCIPAPQRDTSPHSQTARSPHAILPTHCGALCVPSLDGAAFPSHRPVAAHPGPAQAAKTLRGQLTHDPHRQAQATGPDLLPP